MTCVLFGGLVELLFAARAAKVVCLSPVLRFACRPLFFDLHPADRIRLLSHFLMLLCVCQFLVSVINLPLAAEALVQFGCLW
jgi:hypothetical protein